MQRQTTFPCPTCGKNVSASVIEESTRCEHCGKIIELRPTFSPEEREEVAAVGKLPIPWRATIESTPQFLRLTFPAFDPRSILQDTSQLTAAVTFLIVLAFIAALCVQTVLIPVTIATRRPLLEMPVLPIGVALIVSAITWLYLSERVVITVAPTQITVRSILYPGARSSEFSISMLMDLMYTEKYPDTYCNELAINKLVKLMCTEHKHNRFYSASGIPTDLKTLKPIISYELTALQNDGSMFGWLQSRSYPNIFNMLNRRSKIG